MRATYSEVTDAILRQEPGFIVTPPNEEPDSGISVYVSENPYDGYGIDVYLIGNTADVRFDGYTRLIIRSIQDADKVATAIIAFLNKIEESIER